METIILNSGVEMPALRARRLPDATSRADGRHRQAGHWRSGPEREVGVRSGESTHLSSGSSHTASM